MTTFLEIAPLYEYKYNGREYRWEVKPIGPPYWPIRKDGMPYKELPPDGSEFWRALASWGQEEDKERFRV